MKLDDKRVDQSNDNYLNGWEELSDWYDKKQGDEGDLWHKELIDPVLLKLIGEVRGKDVLDLGCGNGYLSRKLAREGARITAIDSSFRMIENAMRHDPNNKLQISYFQSAASGMNFLKDESFDIAFANMSLMDMNDVESAILEAGRVLRKNGRLIASISHPCFDNGKNSGWLYERVMFQTTAYRRIRSYRKPFSESIPWNASPTTMWTTSYHRPLSWYARVLNKSGFVITALEEPEPTEEILKKDKDAQGFLEVPLHLVIESRKL